MLVQGIASIHPHGHASSTAATFVVLQSILFNLGDGRLAFVIGQINAIRTNHPQKSKQEHRESVELVGHESPKVGTSVGTMAKGQIVPEDQQHGMKNKTTSGNNSKENGTGIKHDGNNRDAQSICHERVATVQLKSLEDKSAGISAMFGHKQETKKLPRVYELRESSS